jgi:hypothetical protein
MNRWLSIPAVFCAVAFSVVYALMYGALRGESANNLRPTVPATRGGDAPPSSSAVRLATAGESLMSIDDAQRSLASLRDEWLRPWRQWESSPRRLYSRAAPRPIPSLSAEIQFASESLGESDGCLVGVISVHKGLPTGPYGLPAGSMPGAGSETSSMPGGFGGSETSSIPCVVDRLTSRVRFFHNGRWLTDEEWLATAPLP